MWDDVFDGLRRLTAVPAVAVGAVLLTCALPICGSSRADEDRSRLDRLLEAADDGDWAWAARLARETGLPALQTYVRWRLLLEASDPPSFEAYAAWRKDGRFSKIVGRDTAARREHGDHHASRHKG